MSTHNTGAAREVAPGRLKDFEDSADLDTPGISLPPRRRRAAKQTAPSAPAPVEDPAPTPEPTIQEPPREATPEPAPAMSPTAEPAPAAPASVRARPNSKGPEDRVRPSNVHIPVWLLKPLEEKCKAESLSHGEAIISAIESVYDRLGELIHPPTTVGGGVFSAQRSRGVRQSDGPTTPLNYRLRERDFATLDQIVTDFEASSRSHVITAALKDLFADSQP